MFYRVTNLKMPITSSFDEVFSACAKILGVCDSDILSKKILKKSIDARRREVNFIYSVLIETEKKVKKADNVTAVEIKEKTKLLQGNTPLRHRPVIVGFGPCGMFCALTLARLGYNPIVFERGADVDERTKKVNNFWSGGELCVDTNVQFGEGGAGTFSDGKLTCRIGDERIESVISDFIRHGAPDDIAYQALPHIGTDILKQVVKSMREEIISLGGSVFFNTQVTDINIKNGKLASLILSDGSEVLCDVAVFAIGHSARDTYEMLYRRGMSMIPKTFSVGVRCEHLQKDIDEALYGDFAGCEELGAASYKLSYRNGDIGCYSFCMCPGGTVVTASSEENMVVVNGMSNRARDNINSNSAICINVGENDFGNHPLSAIEFQRNLEKKAFCLGGGSYDSPVQTLGDYIDGNKTKKFGKIKPSVTHGYKAADLNELFTPSFNALMKKAFSEFDKKINGFANRNAVLTGVETRTSAPIRILRNDDLMSISAQGFIPAGEGAGYAGGIMSAAADGIKCAQKIIETYRP